MEWAAGIHDDVAMSGLGSVGMLWCFVSVPISGKVCIDVYVKGGPGWLEDQVFVPCHLEVATQPFDSFGVWFAWIC